MYRYGNIAHLIYNPDNLASGLFKEMLSGQLLPTPSAIIEGNLLLLKLTKTYI
jgi:hypothetical protein